MLFINFKIEMRIRWKANRYDSKRILSLSWVVIRNVKCIRWKITSKLLLQKEFMPEQNLHF